MIVQFKYAGQSGIVNGLDRARVAFATNALREMTYFKGRLARPLLFREALSALNAVVVSDFKYRPRDRLAFKAWLDAQDQKFLAGLALKSDEARKKIEALEVRLGELDRARSERMRPFHKARIAYFQYVYEHEYEENYLFDPVITVHPDELSFEAFSRDESSYARLAAKYDLFESIDAFECGTTNIDFSARLAGELSRMREYRRTEFDVAPSGFTVATEGTAAHKEKKIELPETWVSGFLQVHSTMSMGLTKVTMAPVDLYNLCRFLRRHKTRVSPRALRYEFTPGQRVKVVLEPWEHEIELTGSTPYGGPKKETIRTWGRDRLQTLARLIPLAQHIEVHLAGFGLPSIYVLDLGEIKFTLGLSGWTDNDWTGGAKFDLLTRRLTVTSADLMQVYEWLRAQRSATAIAVATGTALGIQKATSALSYLCQVGRAMYDLGDRVFRHRELFAEPFTMKEAAAAVKPAAEENDPRAKAARAIFDAGNVMLTARRQVSTGYKLSGSAKGSDGARVRPLLSVGPEGQIIEGTCSCGFFKSHAMTKGPCEHILALRLAHMSRLESEDAKGG